MKLSPNADSYNIMASAILSVRGINPRRKWEYERNELFDQVAGHFGWYFSYACTLYVLIGIFS